MDISKKHWSWVPSLYFAQGLPFILINTVSIIIYKRLGLDNAEIAFWTSWLYLPWVIKPLWSPLLEFFGNRRTWLLYSQLSIGVGLSLLAFFLPGPHFFEATLAVFWMMAFMSSTHDIAIDGFYLHAMNPTEQAAFTGIRTTFYRLSMILGQGLLVMEAGNLAVQYAKSSTPSMQNFQDAWSHLFYGLSAFFLVLFAWHTRSLPRPKSDVPPEVTPKFSDTWLVFQTFFQKKNILIILFVLLFYRFAEAQLLKMVAPFLMDPIAKGGLGLNEQQIGWAYGTLGIAAVMLGGILGGLAIAKKGLHFWIWPMVCILHIPNIIFLVLSYLDAVSYELLCTLLAFEQFGYGFGTTGYILFLMKHSEGQFKTAHYAIGTGFMALGMMIPGMFSGKIQLYLGSYNHFFLWVMICTIPGFICAYLMRKITPNSEST
jgi:PAT family beta-lactamase induction signal transducer AmpG